MCARQSYKNNPDSLAVSISGYNCFRKALSDPEKYDGGLLLYFRQLLRIKRRTNLETSSIETLLAELSLPSKNIFSYVQYTALLAIFLWIDLFEEKMSIAHTTGLEYTLICVFNIYPYY